MLKTKIIKKIDQKQLNQKLSSNFKNKYINGEQWFRKPKLWYELTAFSNPYITVYSELVLLSQNLKDITKLLSNRALIFYGLGIGDTEIMITEALLKNSKSVDIYGIEVQRQFINGFIQSLKNIAFEDDNYKINFIGINGLFQEISKRDLQTEIKQAHIILGNTIGNFNENEIFTIFNRLMNNKDILLVGFQTAKKIDKIYRQYSKNKMFNDFILRSVPGVEKLVWKLNRAESQIEAWDDNILVFHSKKKNPDSIIDYAQNYGFRVIKSVNDDNCCVQIYEKL